MKKLIIILIITLKASSALAQDDATLKWLNKNVIPVPIVNTSDESYKYFEPLKSILKNKRIVLLGEEDHVFSTTFEAKTNIIKYLHEELGFNVLAFESPLYNLATAYQTAIRENNESLIKDALYTFWGHVKSTQDLFAYINSTNKPGKTPLKIIGFDPQQMFQYSLPDSLNEFLQKIQSVVLTYKYYPDFITNFKKSYCYECQISRNDQRLLFDVFDDIIYEYDLANSKTSSYSLLIRGIKDFKENMITTWMDAPSLYNFMGQPAPPDSLYGFVGDKKSMGPMNRRDQSMAEDVEWIADKYYKGEKIIIWGANEHTMYNRHMASFKMDSNDIFSSRFIYNKYYKTMGTWLKEYFGEDVYSLGFTTLGGTVSYDRSGQQKNSKIYTLSSSKNSLEYYFSKLKTRNGLLDFSKRINTMPKEITNPLLSHNFIGGDPDISGSIIRFFDGIFFTREMHPLEFIRK